MRFPAPTIPSVAIPALLCVSCLAGTSPPAAPPAEDPAACFERIATVLADDSMEGRSVGSDGLEQAARYLEDEFRRIGLEDGGTGYRQDFPAETGVELGADNRLGWSVQPDARAAGELGSDFTPLGFSSSREFAGTLVFVGYGIRAEPLGYDDYAGVDVRGKVALALRYEPGERDENSPFDGRRPTRWSELRYKALVAREAGAVALVFVAPAEEREDEPGRLPLLRNEVLLSRAGLPVLQVTPAVANAWLASAGRDLSELQAAIDGDFRPRSLPLPAVAVQGRTDVATTSTTTRNIVGVLPGRGELAAEAVVIGAHYDHLGLGGARSLDPNTLALHNGADDNASGVAAMLCAVRALRARLDASRSDRRTLVVAAFSAEELGLGGSGHYVGDPVVPLERTVAMVNLDMVGRLREGRLTAMGSESAPQWEALLRRNAEASLLDLVTGGDGYGPSDQMPFYQKEIPVVHLFTGAHSEYHTASDDVATLNIQGGGRVAGFVGALLGDLLSGAEHLTYAAAGSAPYMGGDSRDYGAYLGSIPDYATVASREDGVALSGVRAGGPADRAGVRAGDTIVEMAGVEIRNLYDLTFVLREHRPGDTVSLAVLRDGERVSLRATLGLRGEARSGGGPPAGAGKVEAWTPRAGRDAKHLLDARERHLADLRQLTFDGENAEAYFSPDGRSLVFQRTPPEGGCDQQYLLDLDSGETTRLSSGKGRTTCGYYAYPGGERLIYATTERADPACPPPPDRSAGYVWALYDYDLVWQAGPGAAPETFASVVGAYDAEATVCMRDGRVVFTSDRDGDLELYVVNPDGSGLRRLTRTPGYDGGAFFTPDCSGIVFRASRPAGPELAEYRSLLARHMVRPGALEIFWMDADGGNVTQLTENGAANFAPYPTPDGGAVLFSSNLGASPREFDIHRVGRDGGEPERITYTPGFDGFPMFSPDGRWLVFASNRPGGHQTNLYIARWVP